MLTQLQLTNFIDLSALVQGILLGLVLIFSSNRKKPTLYLGLFLLTFSLELVTALVRDLGFSDNYPFLNYLPFSFYFLSLPLLYLYTKRVSQGLDWKRDRLHLLPGIMEFFLIGAFCLISIGSGDLLMEEAQYQTLHNYYFFAGLLFSLSYLFLILRLISKHQTATLDFHSNTAGKMLNWIRWIAIYLIVFVVLFIVLQVTPLGDYEHVYLLMTSLNMVFIYWVAISGIMQRYFQKPILDRNNAAVGFESTESRADKVQVHTINQAPEGNQTYATILQPSQKDHSKKQFDTLLKLMDTEKPFLDNNLTISDLAKKMTVSERTLSALVNKHHGHNFNHFINHYRIEEAKQLFTKSEFEHYTMDALAEEAGFNSKATFYSVFKKYMGSTPMKFKKNMIASN